MIKVYDLVKRFDKKTVVDNLNFEVEKGSMFAFLGPNGAGKTTTINILSTLMKPTSGTAAINGFSLEREQSGIKKSIGIVFQNSILDGRMTIRENLEYMAALYNIPSKKTAGRIGEIAELLDIGEFLDSRMRTLSGGTRRKADVAMGLVHEPQLLFLDEPTLGLDPNARRQLWFYMEKLRGEKGITLFVTTHYLEEVNNCDRLCIINRGKLLVNDTPDAIKSKIGEDQVFINTDNNELAASELMELIGCSPEIEEDGVYFKWKEAGGILVNIINNLTVKINEITVKKPSIEDAFIKLTRNEGKSLNDI